MCPGRVFVTHSVPHIHISLFQEINGNIDCTTTNYSKIESVCDIIQFKSDSQKQNSQTLICLYLTSRQK